jgi:hypothetical protein
MHFSYFILNGEDSLFIAQCHPLCHLEVNAVWDSALCSTAVVVLEIMFEEMHGHGIKKKLTISEKVNII